MEKAAAYGAEGFGHVLDLDDSEHYIFSKERLFEEKIYDKLKEIVEKGYYIGDTFEVDDVQYKIV